MKRTLGYLLIILILGIFLLHKTRQVARGQFVPDQPPPPPCPSGTSLFTGVLSSPPSGPQTSDGTGKIAFGGTVTQSEGGWCIESRNGWILVNYGSNTTPL